jgi:hypothetical protein
VALQRATTLGEQHGCPLELTEETNRSGAQRARVIQALVLTGLPGRMPIYHLSTILTDRIYPGNIPGTHLLQRLCRAQFHRIMSIKVPVTPPGIEPAIFWLVAQCLIKQRHGVPRPTEHKLVNQLIPTAYLIIGINFRNLQ